jgi:hypothetical protein
MKYTVLFGRILFSLIFVMAGISHFSKQTIEHEESLHAGCCASHLLLWRWPVELGRTAETTFRATHTAHAT